MSGTAIVCQICGVIGGMRGYRVMANAHVALNTVLVAASLLLILFILLIPFVVTTPHSDILPDYKLDVYVKFLVVVAWIANIAIGYAFRRDLNLIHYREKLSRCTCAYIHAAQQQMAAAAQQAHQAQQQHHSPPPPPPPHSQYITGPDGSRYVVSRPPPLGPPRQNGENGPESWIMMGGVSAFQ